MRLITCLALILSLSASSTMARAQETPAPDQGQAAKKADSRRSPTALRLQVVFSRFLGEKKVSSLPYTLPLNADDQAARLRMGIQVPIRYEGKEVQGNVVYKDVGNNIDCTASSLEDGRYRVACTVDQSSLYSAEGERRAAGTAVGDVSLGTVPVLRMFRCDARLILRDGQSGSTTATDPVSGEVLKVEITLNVVR
jgi:hypothetical protein